MNEATARQRRVWTLGDTHKVSSQTIGAFGPELVAACAIKSGQRVLDVAAEVERVEADAQALPFADGEFDAVISTVGAMFAPDHGATARQLLRVFRPGGTIGLINFPADSWVAEFFATLAPYGPKPPPAPSPRSSGGARRTSASCSGPARRRSS